ncbi:MAG: ComEC/Rec2 family competence protein [Bacteroidia bacterium]|nr:ComEC/Rec2 family competence protein [Bacteroidia bacterium]MCF8427139.1 ComEC/Rec2 family competence protein [Bacteroidia bacterium]MCF8445784.1 ComEC/Rec2 family competence protein [Bacteroidia bacterium]
MASFWQQMPFVRILFPLIGGILVQTQFNWSVEKSSILAALSLLSYFLFTNFYKALTKDYYRGIFFSLLLFCLGTGISQVKSAQNYYQHFSLAPSKALVITLSENPQRKKSGYSAEALVNYGYDSLLVQTEIKGKILLYFKNTEKAALPQYGDQIVIKSHFLEISSAKNPYAFDYQKFLAKKYITHSTFLDSGSWIILQTNLGNPFQKAAYSVQNYIQKTLETNVSEASERGIAEALLYGFDNDIDPETRNAFGRTGTLHVLAVSGMHVGLVFMVLSLLLKPLERKKTASKWLALIQILGIWAYSLLCGFSPSILRASLMFSFVLLGKQLNRSSNPFNSLAASAFFLLLFEPNLIFNVGFQLSYAAVAGILGFYPYLYHSIIFPHKFLDHIWKVFAVSISAQILTLPISIYYFHQLPNYFLIANLLIIPLASFIIYSGILLLLVSPFPVLALWAGKLTSLLIWLTHKTAFFIANLPYSYIDKLFWNPLQVGIYFLLLVCTIIYFQKRDLLFLKFGLTLILLWQFNWVWTNYSQNQIAKFCVYEVKKGMALQITKGQNASLYFTQENQEGSENFERAILPNYLHSGIKNLVQTELDSFNYELNLPEMKPILVANSGTKSTSKEISFLVLHGSKYILLQEMIKGKHIEKAILCKDLPFKKRKAIQKILTNLRIPFYDISENGAFEVSL